MSAMPRCCSLPARSTRSCDSSAADHAHRSLGARGDPPAPSRRGSRPQSLTICVAHASDAQPSPRRSQPGASARNPPGPGVPVARRGVEAQRDRGGSADRRCARRDERRRDERIAPARARGTVLGHGRRAVAEARSALRPGPASSRRRCARCGEGFARTGARALRRIQARAREGKRTSGRSAATGC